MSLYAIVRKTDDLVVGLRVLEPAQAANFPSGADVALIEITQGQYDTANSTGLKYDGSDIYRYKWVDPNFVVQPDTSPVVTFTPAEIKAEVGDVVTVQIDHAGGLDGLQEFFLVGVPTRIDFVSGVAAAVAIETSEPVDFFVTSQQAFQIPTPLHVTIYTRKIGSWS